VPARPPCLALAYLLLPASLPQGLAAAETPAVVASIQPIHSLAAAVMAGVAEPHLLVRGGASPHGYQLKPSDATALNHADLVFWVGPELETFLAKPLQSLGERARAVELLAADGVELLPNREGHSWERHEHDHDAPGQEEGDHDAHIWLSPANARAIVRAMAAALAAADPEHAATYEANRARVTHKLEALENELQAQLTPVRTKPYIVFHDAYQYFEHAFGLAAVGSITVTPDRPPSAARLTALREKIAHEGAVCVFAEPQMPSALVATLVEGSPAAVGELDAEGSTAILPGPEAYFQLMRRNARALVDCLSRAG
jgi:zinc transport system substrate-binding protein